MIQLFKLLNACRVPVVRLVVLSCILFITLWWLSLKFLVELFVLCYLFFVSLLNSLKKLPKQLT